MDWLLLSRSSLPCLTRFGDDDSALGDPILLWLVALSATIASPLSAKAKGRGRLVSSSVCRDARVLTMVPMGDAMLVKAVPLSSVTVVLVGGGV
jgi:hypothetical protein